MAQDARPPIPLELKRKVLVEAGHRCAIPTCRHTQVEIHHIIPFSEVSNHSYENLIALCPNCHSRCRNDNKAAKSGEIDRQSIKMYKQKIMLLSGLLTHFEQNVLDYLSAERDIVTVNGKIFIKTLLDLELVAIRHVSSTTKWQINGKDYYEEPTEFGVVLTDKGKKFISLWGDSSSSDLNLEKALV